MLRRKLLWTGASAPLLLALGRAAVADEATTTDNRGTLFDSDAVPAMARQLAAKPFSPPDSTLRLNYPNWSIRNTR